MYSEQLEQLIQSVIADGVITEKERTVLHKKAVAEGVDEDEIDVYVDGLLAQSKKADKPTVKRDLSVLEKVMNGEVVYYRMKKPMRLSVKNSPILDMFVNLIYVEKHKHERFNGTIGVEIYCSTEQSYKEGGYFNGLKMETKENSFIINPERDFCREIKNPSIKGKDADIDLEWQIDLEVLQFLCEKKLSGFSFDKISLYVTRVINDQRGLYQDDVNNLVAYPVQDFTSFAQVFYRAAIDPTAYPDATIKEGGEEQVVVPVDDNETIARLLCMNPKNLVPIDTDVPCYNQYRDPNSKITIYHIDDSKKLNGQVQSLNKTLHYQFTLYLHAIAKDNEKPQFFFELTCSGGQTSDKEGKHSRKIPFGLVPGDIFLTIGINEYFINALTENTRAMEEQLGRMIKADEHCFYPIKDSVMQQLIQANTFEIVARNEIGNSGRLKPILGNLSMQKKWILSYNILTYPEQKEQLLQEYDDSKVSTKLIKGIKGLFGKK